MTNKSINADQKLIFADITYKVRGAFFSVYNSLGPGHKESVYQKSLAKELDLIDIPYEREATLSVKYKGEKVGDYHPDFVIDEKIIVEVKAVTFMPKLFINQLIHYLKATGFTVGLLVNFGGPKLVVERVIWTR